MSEKKYIERGAALQFVFDACAECMDACHDLNIKTDCDECMLEGVKLKLRDLPAADVRPVVRGKWIDEPIKGIRYHCSVCQGRFDYTWHYCPNCGADMRGEQDV